MFLIGLVHTKNQPINPFQKSINLSNLLMTEKNYSKMARHNVLEIQSMPEIQCEAVPGTNPVHGKLSTNRLDPLTTHFNYITNLCIKTKIVREKSTQ